MKNNKILFAFASILLLSVLDLSAEKVKSNYYNLGINKNFQPLINNRSSFDNPNSHTRIIKSIASDRCYTKQHPDFFIEDGSEGYYLQNAISFDYWDSDRLWINYDIWNYGCDNNHNFKFPLPILSYQRASNDYVYKNGLRYWSAIYEGNIEIPKNTSTQTYDGDWIFSVTINGMASLSICKPDNKDCVNKDYHNYNKRKAFDYSDSNAITISGLKGGDKLPFKIIYGTYQTNRYSPSLHLKWIKKSDIDKNTKKEKCTTPKLEPLSLPKESKLERDKTIFREDGKCGMQIVNFNYKPKSDIEYRVVEDEYVDAYVNKDSGKDFDWLWNSPIRTKDIGDTNKFCIIMGTKDQSGKYVEVKKENQSKIVGARIRYKDYQDKDTMRTLVNHKSEYMVRTPGSGKDMNKSKSCFRMTTVSEKLITKDAYFQVFEFTKNAKSGVVIPDEFKTKGTGTEDSDHFSFKPIGYTLSFSENDSGNKIEPTENDKKLSNIADSVLYLTSAKTYTVTAKAQKKDIDSSSIKDITKYNSTDTFDAVITVVGKYHTEIKDNDPLLTMYLNEKTCQYRGKDLPNSKFDIKFSDNVSNNFISDIGYDDVMRFKTNIVDKTWTAIDQTNEQDKISKYGYECKEPSKQIKGVNAVELFNRDLVDCYISNVVPAYVEFVPASFDITKSVENFNSSNFTYLNTLNADSYRMKAFLNINLAPKNAKGQDLSNFTKDCYAKDLDIVLSYDWDKILRENSNTALIDKKKELSINNKNTASRMKFAQDSKEVYINGDNKDNKFKSAKYYGNEYSNYNYSDLTNSAPFSISKNLFTSNTATAKIGFNFDKDHKKPENPFAVYPKEFSLSDLKIKDKNHPIDIKINDITTGMGSSYATMVYGRVTAPYQEGPKDGFDGKIYYTFYCDVDCSSNIDPRLKGESIGNYVVNLSHSSSYFGNVDDSYDSNFATKLIFDSAGANRISKGIENVRFSNKESVKDTIKLKMSKSPWLIFNENYPTYDYNEIKVGFFGANGSWAGKSYDGKGEDKNNAGKFILDELPSGVDVPVRKNRRIDW
ncbi:hypothetical protein BFG04_02730 [Campylobacter pinnipediorum subsp. pinnipediorum]|uniref:Uncharacterized protein n=1 Tax=Campylobacter pinnipediorum subsp. pinnipediorum TaxID=1660067 RepID=A0AAX0LBQ1_9BACT|nr:hypothetical protein [Campylobacter pinnipediorum]OPA77169.1 hypothetical protein BFG05_04440 [Campylobacter pinnipediorum subsp. pinnipediorum]OPA78955.1 hypothetical protein BFG04_02730 [Campylobacter pinnipediorum subsp. pinnipediorum]